MENTCQDRKLTLTLFVWKIQRTSSIGGYHFNWNSKMRLVIHTKRRAHVGPYFIPLSLRQTCASCYWWQHIYLEWFRPTCCRYISYCIVRSTPQNLSKQLDKKRQRGLIISVKMLSPNCKWHLPRWRRWHLFSPRSFQEGRWVGNKMFWVIYKR